MFSCFCRYGHCELVRLLLQHDADISLCNKSNRSALHAAAENDQGDIVQQLLEKDVDPGTRQCIQLVDQFVSLLDGTVFCYSPTAT